MAEKDIAEKNFMALEDVFADVYNGLLFNGEEVIKPDDLEDVRGFSQYKTDDNKLHEQERDVLKLWKGHGINLAFMGIENQTNVMKEYISDYKINVFDVGDMSLEDIEVFKSDFKMIAEHFVRLRNNEQDYEPDNRSIQHVDEFLKLMSVLTGDTEFLEQRNAYSDEEKESGEVAMDRIMEYRYNKGVVEGEIRGEDLITSLIKKLKENNRINELDRVLNEPEYRKELYKEYGIK